MGRSKQVGIGVLGVLGVLVFASPAFADRFTSPSYTIDASSTGHSLSGSQSSTNYKLVSAGGESVIGNASGGSYKLGQGYTASLEQSLQLTVQPDGLMAYYSFDDPLAETIFDSSSNNLNLKTNNPTQIAGKIGNAIQIANNNSAQVSSVPPITNGKLTVEAWVKYDDWAFEANSNAVARWDGTTTNGNWFLGRSGGAQFRFMLVVNGVNNIILGNSGKSTGVWYHLVATYDGATARLYVNGVEEGSQAVAGGDLVDTSTPLSIGERANNADPYWNGAVDEVKVFQRGMTAAEVSAEYSAQNAGIPAGVALGNVTPGVSQTALFNVVTQTDAPGYGLYANQNQNLTSGGNTIPGVSGSIASPLTWAEGSTKGLGFTLTSTNATAIPGKWSSGNAYAALPGSSTLFYSRTGFTGGNKDILNMRLRLDAATSQPTGTYSNQMIISGTMTP